MLKLFNVILIGLFIIVLAGCSSSDQTVDDKPESTVFEPDPEKAMNHFLNGLASEAKGDFATAILEFQDAVKLDPSAGIYYSLAKNYYFLDKLSLALTNIKKAIQLQNTNVEYYDLLQEIYQTGNEPDSAAAVLEKIIELDSSRVAAYYNLARIYENQKPLQAIETYNKLLDIIGPEWSVLLRITDMYDRIGEKEKAVEAMEELLKLDPVNTGIQKVLIDLYLENEQYDDAIVVVDDILQLYPHDLEARNRKAEILIMKDDWTNAAKEFQFILDQEKVPLGMKLRIGATYFQESFEDSTLLPLAKGLFTTIEQDTSYWQVDMYLGAISVREGNNDLGVEYFSKVTEKAPWIVEAWTRLGVLYFQNEEYEQAILILDQALEKFPEDYFVNYLIGISYAQHDDFVSADEHLSKALKLNPNDVGAISAHSYTLDQLDRKTEAIELMKKALRIEPDNVDFMGTLGMYLENNEQYQQSDSIYNAALKIDSTNALINNNFAYSLSERDIDLERALSMAKVALEAEPKSSSYLDTIGWIYFKLGDTEKAISYIKESLEIEPENSVVLEHLGDVYASSGEMELAIEYWQKALELDSDNEELKKKIEEGGL